jgi:hypothetical protein
LNFLHLLHLLLAGTGMHWLVRRFGFGSFPAVFAGFAYVFNGVTLSCLMWPTYTAFLGWSPWVLGCMMAAWRHGGRWMLLASVASAMQVLAGAPELTVVFWALVGLLWLSEAIGRDVPAWRSLARLASVVAMAAGMTMVQMLPFFDLLLHSQRDASYGGNTWAVPRWGWANLLVPLFHCFQTPQGPWFQAGQQMVCSYYLGVSVLVLAVAGAWLKPTRRFTVLAGMALFCWILALGSQGLVFEWIKRVFPWIGIARYPAKFALFPVILIPVLAASAIEAKTESFARKRSCLLTGIGILVLLLMGCLLWWARRHPLPFDRWKDTALNTLWRAVLGAAVLGSVVGLVRVTSRAVRIGLQLGIISLLPLDAFTHSPHIFPDLPSSNLSPGIWTAAVKQPPPEVGQGRIMTSLDAELKLNFSRVSDMEMDFTGKRLAQWYSLNLLDNVPKVGGGIILVPEKLDNLEKYLYLTPGSKYGEGLLDFLSVAWFSSPENPVVWNSRTNYLPVMTAGQRPQFVTDAQALIGITAQEFDPRGVVYLPESARPFVSVTNRTTCRITNERFQAQTVEADAEASEPAMVVLSQSFYHLWHASIDGMAVPLFRANLAFQALEIPAGRHHITLQYRDPYLKVGAVVSLVALAACGYLWVRAREN